MGLGRGQSKLTPEDKVEVRTLYESGVTIPALMEKYGVNFNAIKKAINPELHAKHVKRIALSMKQHKAE